MVFWNRRLPDPSGRLDRFYSNSTVYIPYCCTVVDMEIQSNDRGRRPQCVQSVACTLHTLILFFFLFFDSTSAVQRINECVYGMRTHGCMASALGPLDVRPDFHVHSSSTVLTYKYNEESKSNVLTGAIFSL